MQQLCGKVARDFLCAKDNHNVFHCIGIDPASNSGKKRVTAGVAQLVEHPICNRAVGSSSLSASTILPVTACVNTL